MTTSNLTPKAKFYEYGNPASLHAKYGMRMQKTYMVTVATMTRLNMAFVLKSDPIATN